MPIAPTLILGLGGTGSKIVKKVAEMVDESGSDQKSRIAYVVFDTDQNELGEIEQSNLGISTVQTSTRNTVGDYLTVNTNARDNWFPINEILNRKTLTNGAAQVRAISRLAFDTTLKGGHLDPLHRAIEKLFQVHKDQEEQSLRVIITSSLAGGTGSGIILSVGMYLANYLRTKYPKAQAITRGFFIQPEVFNLVIKGSEEQRNLQVNAYATIRELDAFLMKGDNTLPPQYKDLKFEFPRVAADGVDEISAMPFDFCFLFDSQSASSGGGLGSFEAYLDHAATCIYTLSIGPMAKKSNSREDNVLREVIKNDGRNRYAGAGASRIVYPWQHVRDYVAYQWTQRAIGEQWLKFDNAFKKRRAGLEKQREDGYAVQDLDIASEYSTLIEESEDRDPFAKAIKLQCMVLDAEGLPTGQNRWTEAQHALKRYAEKKAGSPAHDARRAEVQSRIGELRETADAQDYVDTYNELQRYRRLVDRDTAERASILGYSVFKAEVDHMVADEDTFQLEHYLQTDKKFIHPVSARYFLYQFIAKLQSERARLKAEFDSDRQYFDGFEQSVFDDPGTGDIETATDFEGRKASFMEVIRKKPGPQKLEMIDKFNSFVRKVDEYRDKAVYDRLLSDGLDYAIGLARAFEIFFTRLDGNLRDLERTVGQLRVKYDGIKGSTTIHVLSDAECLDHLYKDMEYQGGVNSIDSELASAIYSKVREYSTLAEAASETFFQDLYKDTIIGYFSNQVMKSHGEQIRIDIIEALERQAKIKTGDYEDAKVLQYVEGEIEKAKKLAAPFLEQPLGEDRHPIEACAYNPAIAGENDPKRKGLVDDLLGNYGGEKDREISRQEILFYNALYGIRARDLSKYSPERHSLTERRAAGQFFSAYYQFINEIKPTSGETKVITPHIDRRWHTVAMLPDLDEGNQARIIKDVHAALIGGLAYDRIKWQKVYGDVRLYQYHPDRAQPEDFMVSNGTPCDQFYEVVDALTIDPVAVRQIKAAVARQIENEQFSKRGLTFAQSRLSGVLEAGIPLPEWKELAGIDKDPNARATVLDVAAFYGVSLPRDKYSDAALREISQNLIAYVREAIDELEDESQRAAVLERTLRQQFEQFRKHVPHYRTALGADIDPKLRTVVLPVQDVLEDLNLGGLLADVRAFANSL